MIQAGRNLSIVSESSYEMDSKAVDASEVDNEVPFGTQLNKPLATELPKGADRAEQENGEVRTVEAPLSPRSSFNEYNSLRIKKVDGTNYPLTDEQLAKQSELLKNIQPIDLIKNPLGASIFKYADFLYVDKYKKVPLNRLITLRRFAYPVMDDIFSNFQTEPDISRLLTYSEHEINNFTKIMNFSCGIKWKELKSSVQPMSMHGPQEGVSGFARNVLKYVDPTFGQNALRGDHLNFNPLHDTNKVYGMVDSIDSTHIRDIGLNFEQTIALSFKYKMRSINGVNQKAAFLDILGNVLLMATNHGKFWGGDRFHLGPRPTKYMKNLKFLNPRSFDEFLTGGHLEFKNFLGAFGGKGGKENAKEKLKEIAGNALNLALGKTLNKLGRVGIPYMNSLLTGNPVGEYHLTIGNPLNPIMTIGNLIATNTTITFGNVLGIDDFPDEMRVNMTLKHAMPRDIGGIESMFNAGAGRIYLKPKDIMSKTRGNISTSSKPSAVKTAISNGVDSVFGAFDKSSVLRNKNAVWSFLQE